MFTPATPNLLRSYVKLFAESVVSIQNVHGYSNEAYLSYRDLMMQCLALLFLFPRMKRVRSLYIGQSKNIKLHLVFQSLAMACVAHKHTAYASRIVLILVNSSVYAIYHLLCQVCDR